MNSSTSTLAGSRLRIVGTFAAFLAWAMALFELTFMPALFIFRFPETHNGYLQLYGAAMPLLLEPGYQASPLAVGLLLVAGMIPTLMSATALLLIALFFHRICRGQIWTRTNINVLWWCGLLCVGNTLLWPLAETLQGLALAIDLPPGKRSFSLSLGISSEAVYEIIKGILLCAFSLLMRDAKAVSEEQSNYV